MGQPEEQSVTVTRPTGARHTYPDAELGYGDAGQLFVIRKDYVVAIYPQNEWQYAHTVDPLVDN